MPKVTYGGATELEPQDKVAGIPVSDDYRWQVALDLDMSVLDSELENAHGEWVLALSEQAEQREAVGLAKDELAAVEASILALMPEVEGKTKAEREQARRAIIEADPRFKAALAQLREAERLLAEATLDLELAAKGISVLTTRLSWRARMLGFLGSIGRIPMQDVSEALPELGKAEPCL